MFHCFFTIYNTAPRCNHRIFHIQVPVNLILYCKKSVISFLRDNLFEQSLLLLLYQQIRIHKLISKPLGNYNTHRTFSYSRHSNQNNIFHMYLSIPLFNQK